MVCYGLPSFAQFAMYRMYNYESPSIFTFPPGYAHIAKLFRENTFGGIVNTYQRHVTTMDEEAAYAAKYNFSGNFTSVKYLALNIKYMNGI
jgi:hypothetical protein